MEEGLMYECDCGEWTTNRNRKCLDCIIKEQKRNEEKAKSESLLVV